MKVRRCFVFAAVFFLTAIALTATDVVRDGLSYSHPDEVVITHLDLNLQVHFDQKILSGKATLHITNPSKTKTLYLDSLDLKVDRVTIGDPEQPATFHFGDSVPTIRGKPLVIDIEPDTKLVHIYYSTVPEAEALQWLDPQLTIGKKHPLLLSQSEPTSGRSWIPCQDTPSVRMTYTATIQVPADLFPVMSAENPTAKSSTGIYHFRMDQPIPSYLIAIAVGDLVFKETGKRTGVYAEPAIVDRAAWEFADTEKMMQTTEKLYGPYRWGRYDLLILPPTFPYGGMENPRLSFINSILITGDRSLIMVIAHELAHSWSGNLVTNGRWEDFWLNEGVTTYINLRVVEELYGKEYKDKMQILNVEGLKDTLERIGENSSTTKLHLDDGDVNSEDANSTVPYVKGALFLELLEQAVGRSRWDLFLKTYFNEFAFKSVTTEQFVAQLLKFNPQIKTRVDIDQWLYGTGLPKKLPALNWEAFDDIDAWYEKWGHSQASAPNLPWSKWPAQDQAYFIDKLTPGLGAEKLGELDDAWHLSKSTNSYLLSKWFLKAVQNRYSKVYPDMEAYLVRIGRTRYIYPIYHELARTPEGLQYANEIYAKASVNYHPLAKQAISGLLESPPGEDTRRP